MWACPQGESGPSRVIASAIRSLMVMAQPPWSDGLVGVGQGVGDRAVLLVERSDEWPEARLGGDVPRSGVVGDRGGERGIPAVSDEVQATIDGMEPAA